MILSHKHKFIFLKTQKTAGTSIEIALSRFCGERDIITPISPDDEVLRKELGYRGPQNYRLKRKDGGKFELYNHVHARKIHKIFGDRVWRTYYKFCVERNPWDKILSWYFYVNQKEPRPSLSEFIQAGHGNLVGGAGGFDIYSNNGDIVVDRVCLYENLDEEMKYIEKKLNLPEGLELPRAKSTYRKEKRHYRELLSEQDRLKISRVFAREIAYLGYKY